MTGKLLLSHLDSGETTLASDQGPSDWASLQLPKAALPSFIYVACRKSVRLFDLRVKPVAAFRQLYQFEGNELLGGLSQPIEEDGEYSLFGCTNRQVFLLDSRMPSEVVELCHASDVAFGAFNREPVPLGCSIIKIPNTR